jgi:hypothetical protein
MNRHVLAFAIALWSLLAAAPAAAFCGLYVSGADAQLYNNATRVSLLRDGKRTVLAMQNNYEGPPEDFAMVVPVPVVLEKEMVKTVEDKVFEKLDTLSAPRLVEYWEADPCPDADGLGVRGQGYAGGGSGVGALGSAKSGQIRGGKVKIQAKFKVGEYDIVILSSTESTALEDWLTQNDYNIPDGAAPYFRPYIQKGQYFFVARVNMDKVTYKDGEAVLSPIRFHYDSDDFTLPVRLGLINSKGAQDLIAFILARNQRYEVANLPNVTTPTNIPVKPETKDNFGAFYRELFDTVLKENPQAVVTEYAWNTASCDPCPGATLSNKDLLTLGADATPSMQRKIERGQVRSGNPNVGRDWVVTRLHTRYGKHTLGEDLVFSAAPGIQGGRGMPQGPEGTFASQAAEPAGRNNFQGRYIIRHFWDGEVECENPRRGIWGGRPGGIGDADDARAAGDVGFSEPGEAEPLATFVDQENVPGLAAPTASYNEPAGDVVESWGKLVEAPSPAAPATTDQNEEGTKPTDPAESSSSGRGGCASDSGGDGAVNLVLLVLFGLGVCRRFELASSSRLG